MTNKNNIFFAGFLFIILSVSSAFAADVCMYASSASATSENTAGSLAIYATGAPDAPFMGDCVVWSGYGYSWTPANWVIKANLTLTLNYTNPVYVKNFTIFGDYDMCWSSMILKNSKTGEQTKVFEGVDKNCTSSRSINSTFLADTLILETCGNGWSSTDAIQMCGCEVACFNNSDCGLDGFTGEKYCKDSGVYRDYQEFTCINSGTCESYCSSDVSSKLIENCIYGCNNMACITCPDKDKDGVCDENDKCPNSRPNEMIDKSGCDPFQFCKRFICGDTCQYADFKNNEFGKNPFDCTTVIINKKGVLEPKCVPLTCTD